MTVDLEGSQIVRRKKNAHSSAQQSYRTTNGADCQVIELPGQLQEERCDTFSQPQQSQEELDSGRVDP